MNYCKQYPIKKPKYKYYRILNTVLRNNSYAFQAYLKYNTIFNVSFIFRGFYLFKAVLLLLINCKMY